MDETKPVRLLVPRPAHFVRQVDTSGRGLELNQITVSLLANGKESAEIFFDRFQELFAARLSGIKMRRFRKPPRFRVSHFT